MNPIVYGTACFFMGLVFLLPSFDHLLLLAALPNHIIQLEQLFPLPNRWGALPLIEVIFPPVLLPRQAEEEIGSGGSHFCAQVTLQKLKPLAVYLYFHSGNLERAEQLAYSLEEEHRKWKEQLSATERRLSCLVSSFSLFS